MDYFFISKDGAVKGDPKMHTWHPTRPFMTLNYTNPESSPIQNKLNGLEQNYTSHFQEGIVPRPT